MIYFKSEAGEVFAFNDGDLVPGGYIPLTEEEVEGVTGSPVMSDGEKVSAYRAIVGRHIDDQARNTGPFGFDSILSAVSYADDMLDTVNQPYGLALREWRRDCLDAARAMLLAWQEGGPEPTEAEVIAGLPEFVSP